MPHEPLYRSRTDRVLFGVAGGMADWLDQDPGVVRLVWAALVVFGGAGLILYIIAAVVIPEEPFEMSEPPSTTPAPAASPTQAGTVPPAGAGGGIVSTAWARPRSRAERRAARRAARGPSSAGVIVGLLLILAGGWAFVREFLPWVDERLFGPGLLIVLGLLVIVAATRPSGPPSAP